MCHAVVVVGGGGGGTKGGQGTGRSPGLGETNA